MKYIHEWNWLEIQTFYDNNKSTRETTKQFNISFATISKAVKLKLFKVRNRVETGKLRNSYGKPLSVEVKERISRGMKKAVLEGRQRTPKPYGLTPTTYKGVELQSGWELKVAQFLDDRGIKWQRPKNSFPYTYHNRTLQYFPDFYLLDYDLYIEVKGWLQEKDLCKWKDFPHKLLVIDKSNIHKLEVEFSRAGGN